MIESSLREKLPAVFENIRTKVFLKVFYTKNNKSDYMQFAEAMRGLSPLLEVADEESENYSGIHLTGVDLVTRIKFEGLPMGHEFTSLVLAILWIGGHPTKLTQEEKERISRIPGPVVFDAYISLTCHNCPDVVQALIAIAVENENVQVNVIDGGVAQDKVTSLGVQAVPSVFKNGALMSVGRVGISDILEKLGIEEIESSLALGADGIKDVAVVGGGPAGISAAIYLARKGLSVAVIAERIGGQLQDTADISNYIGLPSTTGSRLTADMSEHMAEYGIDVISSKVKRMDTIKKTLYLEGGRRLGYKGVILAPGATWRKLVVPGEDEYRGKGVSYCPHCDGPMFKNKVVAVIGGGNSGVEAAIDLSSYVRKVILIQSRDYLKADSVLVSKLDAIKNIEVRLSTKPMAITGDGTKVSGLHLNSGGKEVAVELDGVFVQIGTIPNTDWISDAVIKTETGEVIIGEDNATSEPLVFAAGDATTVPFKQVIIAAGEGAKAALGLFNALMRA